MSIRLTTAAEGAFSMIILGLGANLDSESGTGPAASLDLACERLAARHIKVVGRSSWVESAPVPVSDQPWYVNGVVAVSCDLSPQALLSEIKALESEFGRDDQTRWAARPMDIDILDYKGKVLPDAAGWLEGSEADRSDLVLPHPRLHLRRFVLVPLAEMTPEWQHPVFAQTAQQLLAELDDDPASVRPLKSDPA